MDREETKKILAVIDNVYPNWHPKDATLTVNVWTTLLKDYSYRDVGEALKRYMVSDKQGFAPVPGQLIDILHTPEDDSDFTDLRAWSMVRKAISNGNYNADSEYKKLPLAIRRAVGSPDNLKQWAMMDIEAVDSVIQSNFLRSYRAVLKREREMRRYGVKSDWQDEIEGQQTPKIETSSRSMVDLILDMKQGKTPPDMSNDFTRRLYAKFGEKAAVEAV